MAFLNFFCACFTVSEIARIYPDSLGHASGSSEHASYDQQVSITDILYLDRPRARRLLGEVEGGVVEQVVSSVASRRSGHLAGKIPGLLEGGGERGGDATVEETLSVDDALLSVVEETLEKAELFVASDGLDDPSAWAAGRIHSQLAPAQVVRVTCDAQIIDPQFFNSSVHRVMQALETMAIFAAGDAAMQKGAKDRERISKRVVKEILGGMSPDLVRQVGDAIEKFFGEGVFIRQLPCGPEYRSYGLMGPKSASSASAEPCWAARTQALSARREGRDAPSPGRLIARAGAAVGL